MATTDGRRSHSALDAALDIFRMRQYFNVIVRARDTAADPRRMSVRRRDRSQAADGQAPG